MSPSYMGYLFQMDQDMAGTFLPTLFIWSQTHRELCPTQKSVFFWDQPLVSQNRTILHSLTLTHSDHRGALQKSAQFWLSTSGSRQVTRFFVTIWLGWWHWFVWFRTRVAIKSESHVPHSPQLYVGFKHVLHRYTTLVNQTILLHWVNY